MCATWAFATYDDNSILYADTNIFFNGKNVGNTRYGKYVNLYKKANFLDPFFIKFRDKRRWMRPDLVFEDGGLNILDWKYMDKNCFIGYDKKAQQDLTKQLCYEFSLKNLKSSSLIFSELFIPWFYVESVEFAGGVGYFLESAMLHQRFQDNQIQVLKANFSKIQKIYLTHD